VTASSLDAPVPLRTVGGDATATDLASRFIRRQRKIMGALLVAGVLLFIAGCTGFGIYGNRQQELLKTGTQTTATVTAVAPYIGGSPFNPTTYNEHIDVEFPTQTGRLGFANIGIGESDHYWPGEQVEIVYNPSNPSQAVFAHGYTDIGSAGFFFLVAIVLGFCLGVFAYGRRSMCRRAAWTLRTPARRMTATSRLLPRGRYQKWAITLASDTTPPVSFWSWTKIGCSLLREPTEVTVFGELKPRTVALVVDASQQVAVGGWIPRRWREPKSRRRGSAAPVI
jgi:hypothetical protein